jgi:hypothetical protein
MNHTPAETLWRKENRLALMECGLWAAFEREYRLAYMQIWRERKAKGKSPYGFAARDAFRRVMRANPRWEAVTLEECRAKLRTPRTRKEIHADVVAHRKDAVKTWLRERRAAHSAIRKAFLRLRARYHRPKWHRKIRRAIRMYRRKRSVDDLLIQIEQYASRLPNTRAPNLHDDTLWVYQNLGMLARKNADGTLRLNSQLLLTAPSTGALSMAAFALANRKEFFNKFVFKILTVSQPSPGPEEPDDDDDDWGPVGRSEEAEAELEALGAHDVRPTQEEPRDQREGKPKPKADFKPKPPRKRAQPPPSELDDLSNFPEL